MILSTAYFPPTEYFAILARYSVVYLEACENYSKQSYRNRCRILTSTGIEDLRFPIIHDGSSLITDIRVDYSTPWLRQTEYAIETAYSSSPFFEYYRDELFAILDSRPERLWDLNRQLIDFFCRKIGIAPEIRLTTDFEKEWDEDFRFTIHPKKSRVLETPSYWQVFGEKLGFVPGLSVMDLLFNEGPESICYLK